MITVCGPHSTLSNRKRFTNESADVVISGTGECSDEKLNNVCDEKQVATGSPRQIWKRNMENSSIKVIILNLLFILSSVSIANEKYLILGKPVQFTRTKRIFS